MGFSLLLNSTDCIAAGQTLEGALVSQNLSFSLQCGIFANMLHPFRLLHMQWYELDIKLYTPSKCRSKS